MRFTQSEAKGKNEFLEKPPSKEKITLSFFPFEIRFCAHAYNIIFNNSARYSAWYTILHRSFLFFQYGFSKNTDCFGWSNRLYYFYEWWKLSYFQLNSIEFLDRFSRGDLSSWLLSNRRPLGVRNNKFEGVMSFVVFLVKIHEHSYELIGRKLGHI